jgi:spoIIIJ-associated protein
MIGGDEDIFAVGERPEASESTPAPTEQEPKDNDAAETVSADGALAASILSELLRLMCIECECSLESCEDRHATLVITGPDVGLAIGRHGRTIDALQYLTVLMYAKQKGHRITVTINAEHYRERRSEQLAQMAQRLAKQVSRTGNEAVLEPLRPHERRVVHMELAHHPDVTTYSEGEEPFRRVVISPKH